MFCVVRMGDVISCGVICSGLFNVLINVVLVVIVGGSVVLFLLVGMISVVIGFGIVFINKFLVVWVSDVVGDGVVIVCGLLNVFIGG